MYRTSSPDPPTVLDWLTRLRLRQGTPEALYQLERNILGYHDAGKLYGALETYTATLPLLNQDVFDRFSLFLMQQYRRLSQEPSARRVYRSLLLYRGQDPDIASRATYFDLVGRLQTLPAGQRPAAADSLQLAQLAQGRSAEAGVACALLHQYYPHVPCNSEPTPALRPAVVSTPPLVATLSEAYPNPAGNQTHFSYALHQSAHTLSLAIYDLKTGRVVRQLPLKNHARGEFDVDVMELPSGFYACKLLLDGQVAATRKLAVSH